MGHLKEWLGIHNQSVSEYNWPPTGPPVALREQNTKSRSRGRENPNSHPILTQFPPNSHCETTSRPSAPLQRHCPTTMAALPPGAPGLPPAPRADGIATAGADLMEQYGLTDVLKELRSRKLRSTFMHYISEMPVDKVPVKPRCPGGTLGEIARQPINEDERPLDEFEERVLRNALTFKESNEPVKMPEWLEEEQPWENDERRKKKKDKKKKKKKKKRKRGGDDDDARPDDDERRMRKKRK